MTITQEQNNNNKSKDQFLNDFEVKLRDNLLGTIFEETEKWAQVKPEYVTNLMIVGLSVQAQILTDAILGFEGMISTDIPENERVSALILKYFSDKLGNLDYDELRKDFNTTFEEEIFKED